jgi:organic hydroperoxide reductase OsmC/OhrA
MIKDHHYQSTVQWTGNKGAGTCDYASYERSHKIGIESKPDILGSSDPAFRGDKTKHNPEDLLVSSLSACHMLWYLHLCAQSGVVVLDYIDHATGIMTETENGGGHFTQVTLNPIVTVLEERMIDLANDLHAKANERCFIANSVNFPVYHKPTTILNG